MARAARQIRPFAEGPHLFAEGPAVFAQGGIPRRGPCVQNPITCLLAHKVSPLFFHLARPGVAEA